MCVCLMCGEKKWNIIKDKTFLESERERDDDENEWIFMTLQEWNSEILIFSNCCHVDACDMLCQRSLWKNIHITMFAMWAMQSERRMSWMLTEYNFTCSRSSLVLPKNNKNSLKSNLHIFYPSGMASSNPHHHAAQALVVREICWSEKVF